MQANWLYSEFIMLKAKFSVRSFKTLVTRKTVLHLFPFTNHIVLLKLKYCGLLYFNTLWVFLYILYLHYHDYKLYINKACYLVAEFMNSHFLITQTHSMILAVITWWNHKSCHPQTFVAVPTSTQEWMKISPLYRGNSISLTTNLRKFHVKIFHDKAGISVTGFPLNSQVLCHYENAKMQSIICKKYYIHKWRQETHCVWI